MDRSIYRVKGLILIAFVTLDTCLAIQLYAATTREVPRATTQTVSRDTVQPSRVTTQYTPEKTPDTETEVSLLAVGDIMLARAVGGRITRHGVDYPFDEMRDILGAADITFGNLETPIIEGAPVPDNHMTFRSDIGVEEGIARAGFDILSLANNHTMNFGVTGLERTLELLADAQIAAVGAGNHEQAYSATVVEREGIRFAFLAYVDTAFTPDNYAATTERLGVAMMDVAQMQQDVAGAKQDADVVIVSMHAGDEYTAAPDAFQQEFAHAAIDAGAEIVIGHHPHVVQTVEQYNGKYILYSLGNFVFDQGFSKETVEGLAAEIFFRGTQVDRIAVIPIVIEDYAQPRRANPQEALSIIERLGPVTDTTPYTYQLHDGRLTARAEGAVVWSSPEEWWVDAFAVGDVTGDGVQEITLSVWKSGNFGPSQPFWINENDPSIRNHFFVFALKNSTLEPLWQSSNLDHPNCAYVLADVDGNEVDELVVTEGEYAEGRTCEPKYYAVWKWNEWGFVNEWRSEPFQ